MGQEIGHILTVSVLQALIKFHSKHQLGLWSHARLEWRKDSLLCSHDSK